MRLDNLLAVEKGAAAVAEILDKPVLRTEVDGEMHVRQRRIAGNAAIGPLRPPHPQHLATGNDDLCAGRRSARGLQNQRHAIPCLTLG